MAVNTASFDFEKPLVELEEKLAAARARLKALEPSTADGDGAVAPAPVPDGARQQAEEEARSLQQELERLREELYGNLAPWQRVQIARHKDRPRASDYVEGLCTEFIELHGDRAFGDDAAVVCGTARFRGRPVVIVGQQKGKDTKENVERNFGMMNPEGYRKALRVMRLADKFHMPILVFVDTPGAFPGVGAEERGQAEAIARNIQEMMGLRVPVIMTVIGEGASGGALGVGLADRVLMLENSWYCVISPEGCAAILFREAEQRNRAAELLKLTATDLMDLGVIDEIVPEPQGGAHRDTRAALNSVGDAIGRHLEELTQLDAEGLLDARFAKYRSMGTYREEH